MKIFNYLVVVTLITMTSLTGYAAEEALNPETPAAAKLGMDPAQMEKMKSLMAPTAAHKALEAFAGKWTYAGKFWMTPEAPAQEMTGSAENTMIFGGRFLKQEFEGPWMGETFQGLGYTGYDNIKHEYETTWLDSMGTGLMKVSGQFNAATKTLSQSGANSCPLTGEKARAGRSTWTVVDNDHNTYTSYLTDPSGKEFKSMEINYTRAA